MRPPRWSPRASGPRPPRVGCALAAALLVVGGACRGGPDEIDLAAFPVGSSDGVGGGVSLGQRLVDLRRGRLDFELGLERQTLERSGPEGDGWTRIFGGVRVGPRTSPSGPEGALGVSWVRSNGVTDELEEAGDYGGAHLGLGWRLALAPGLATGPELTLLYLDAEGNRGGSGVVLELAWRLVARF